MRYPTRSSGFTLVELSVVLVVIGLIVGGVLVGMDLIRTSELRSVIGDTERYVTAVNAFRGKYGYFPGDMPKAESVWGSDASCPNTPVDTVPKAATCNGDGDGRVAVHMYPTSNAKESYRAWQQLANAGLIAGSFTGTSSATVGNVVFGRNAPQSRINNAGYILFNISSVAANGALSWLYFSGPYENSVLFGAAHSGDLAFDPALPAQDAQWVDAKVDDGFPGNGKVVTVKKANGYASSNCASTNNAATAVYDLTQSGIQCNLIFKGAF